jgi:valyl-tRNA synthetase
LDGVSRKLANAEFLRKAPEEIVTRVTEKRERLEQKKNKLENQLNAVTQLAGNG